MLLDDLTIAALESYVDEAQRLLDQAKAQKPIDKDEVSYWRAQHRAFSKALHYYSNGVRLTATPGGYTLPSASRPGAVVHRLWRVGGIWHCSCEARTLCWHHAMVDGADRAIDLADLAGDADPIEQDDPPPPPTPIRVSTAADGALTLSRGDVTLVVTQADQVAGAVEQLRCHAVAPVLCYPPADGRALGARIAKARAKRAA